MSICVVGAGISGLATAVRIQELAPEAKVTIIAEKFTPDTVSDIPAGVWRPTFHRLDPRKELIRKWAFVTFKRMTQLWTECAKDCGINMVSGYDLSHKQIDIENNFFWADIAFGFRKVQADEMKRIGFGDFCDGVTYTTFCLQPAKYLPCLMKQFQENGGQRQALSGRNLALSMKYCIDAQPHTVIRGGIVFQIAQDFDVIVNCSGLGSRELVDDHSAYPVRGQVFRVRAPFLKIFLCFTDPNNEFFYALPNHDSVVLGGTHDDNDWDTRVRKTDSQMIWSNLTKFLPCLKDAEILQEAVGLRPGRDRIRLETETTNFNGKSVPVVHNYGHGGAGVSLFYGCACDAAEMAVKSLNRILAKL